MEEFTSPTEMREAFNEINGIEANRPRQDDGKMLVKVNEEDAIGQFFRLCRENDLNRAATTRGDLDYTVLDSWVYPNE